MSLTEFQKRQIEEKRRLALLKQQQNTNQASNASIPTSAANLLPNKISSTSHRPVFVNSSKRPLSQIYNEPNQNKPLIISDPEPASKKVANFFSRNNASSFYQKTQKPSVSYPSKVDGKSILMKDSKNDGKDKNNFNPQPTKLEVGCFLISENQFELRNRYDSVLVSIYKDLPRKEYDATTRTWKFPIEDYNMVINKVRDACAKKNLEIEIKPLPPFLLKLCERNASVCKIQKEKKLDWSQFPETSEELMEFQKEGILFAICCNGRALIADEMGLGKTVQALMIAYNYQNEWPLLIICPSSVRNTWADSIVRWLPGIPLERVSVIYSSKDIFAECRPLVLIVSYAMVPKLKTDLLKFKFKVAILDESHFVKTGKAIRTKAVQEVVRTSQRLLLLSGTPMMSKPIELFTQLQLLDKSSFSNQTIYGARYCDAKQRPWGLDLNGSSNLDEFKVLLNLTGFIRRLKKDVLSQLPPKTRKIVSLDKSVVKNKEKTFSALSKQISCIDSSKLLSGSNKQLLFEFFTASALAKLPAVIEYVDEILESGAEKFLLFAHHVEMLDGISDYLNDKRLDFIRIDGRTLSSDRQPLVDKFQTDPNCRVALLSITAANTGITLTAATLIIFAELYWNPGDLVQAEDRAYRIGQHCNLMVHYLIAEKTADDQIWPMVKNKLSIMNKAGLSNDCEDFKNAQYGKQVIFPKDQTKLNFPSQNNVSNSKITNYLKSESNQQSASKIMDNNNVEPDQVTGCGVSSQLDLPDWDASDVVDQVDAFCDAFDDDWGTEDEILFAADELFDPIESTQKTTSSKQTASSSKQIKMSSTSSFSKKDSQHDDFADSIVDFEDEFANDMEELDDVISSGEKIQKSECFVVNEDCNGVFKDATELKEVDIDELDDADFDIVPSDDEFCVDNVNEHSSPVIGRKSH